MSPELGLMCGFFREESVRIRFSNSFLGKKPLVQFQFRGCVFIYGIFSLMHVGLKFLRLCYSFAVVAGIILVK